MKDEISDTLIECPECKEMVASVPAESVLNQALRGCPECGAIWFIDLETLQEERGY